MYLIYYMHLKIYTYILNITEIQLKVVSFLPFIDTILILYNTKQCIWYPNIGTNHSDTALGFKLCVI